MKKVIVYIVIVVTILIFAISARAETEFEVKVSECEIHPTIQDEIPMSIIQFNYNGTKLSFYWTGTVKCWKTFVITINDNNECIYARYTEFTIDDFIDGCNEN